MKIIFILIIALILRLINLNQSLWLDEAINVVYSQKYNFWDFLTIYSLGDFHPPLYFAILWIWTHLFGMTEAVVRMPSVIFGVLTVWLTYLIGKNLFNQKTGLAAAVILAFNPLHIYYSQEARMYSLAAFSVAFSFWALLKLLKDNKYLPIYALSVALILYSDYLVYFVLISQFLYIIWQERKHLFTVILGMIAGGLLWTPWLLIFPDQLKTGQTAATQISGWANVVGGAGIKELALVWVKSLIGRVSFDNKYLYTAIVSGVSALYLLILFKSIKSLTKEVKLLLLWIIIPVLLAYLVSLLVPILAYFRMIFILPGLAIALGYGIDKFSLKNQKIIALAILFISSFFLILYYKNPEFQRENWKEAIAFVKHQNAIVFFEDSNIPAPAQYYKCEPLCLPALFNFPAKTESDLLDIASLSSISDKVYLFDYLVEISDLNRLVAKELEKAGFRNTQTHNFDGVGFIYEYSK